jgi:hypothetical protein
MRPVAPLPSWGLVMFPDLDALASAGDANYWTVLNRIVERITAEGE